MLEKLKEKLKLRYTPPDKTKVLDNWAIAPHSTEYFDESFFLVSYLPDGKIFRTGIIAFQDWKSGEAEDVYGQKYKLGKVYPEYLEFLKKSNSHLLQYVLPKSLSKELH